MTNGARIVSTDDAVPGVRDGVLSVLVCRGCCCGQQEGVDHDRHLVSLREATERAGGRLRVTNCIGPCDRKNVVVVRSRTGQGRWRASYFAGVDDETVDALCGWLPEAATGKSPPELRRRLFRWPLPRAELLARATAT